MPHKAPQSNTSPPQHKAPHTPHPPSPTSPNYLSSFVSTISVPLYSLLSKWHQSSDIAVLVYFLATTALHTSHPYPTTRPSPPLSTPPILSLSMSTNSPSTHPPYEAFSTNIVRTSQSKNIPLATPSPNTTPLAQTAPYTTHNSPAQSQNSPPSPSQPTI